MISKVSTYFVVRPNKCIKSLKVPKSTIYAFQFKKIIKHS
jgi:hypothetical protein